MQAAEVMGQMEHLLNVYAAKAAPQSVAHFLGYIEVTSAQATKSLTEGLWLVSGILRGSLVFDMVWRSCIAGSEYS